MDNEFTIDETPVPFAPGQTILEAAKAAGIYIPHLCFQPDFHRHGGCKLCTVLVNGRTRTACTMKAAVGQEIDVNTPELDAMRRSLVQMLFIEGNHFCPGCEKSGACQLQALGYEYEMLSPHFVGLYPQREVDASHPDVLIDFNRCIDPLEQLAHGENCYPITCGPRKNISLGCNKCFTFWSMSVM